MKTEKATVNAYVDNTAGDWVVELDETMGVLESVIIRENTLALLNATLERLLPNTEFTVKLPYGPMPEEILAKEKPKTERQIFQDAYYAEVKVQPLSEVINTRCDIHNDLLKLEKASFDLRAKRDVCDGLILNSLSDSGMEKTSTERATVYLRKETFPKVTDWTKLYDYIQETQRWGLLHRKISAFFYKDIRKGGEEVPGISETTLNKLAFRKRS